MKNNLLLITLALLTFQTIAQSFSKSQVYDSLELTKQPNRITLFDYDQDSDEDIFCYNGLNDKRILVYQNNNGVFDSSFVFYTGSADIEDIAIMDYDLDSDLDIIAIEQSSTDLIKFENLGSGNFNRSTQANITPSINHNIEHADMDNDTLPDLVYASFSPHQIRWVKNLGGGNFSTSFDTVAILNDRVNSFELADLDNDGKVDVFTQYGRINSRESAISINGGNGNFSTTTSFPVSNNLSYGYTLGDFNNDSLIDLAYVKKTSSSEIIILWNDSVNNFSTTSVIRSYTLGSGRGPITLEKFDFDGDNNLDLLVGDLIGNTASEGIVLKNQGNGTFNAHTDKINGAAWNAIYNGNNYRGIEMFFSDFNGDNNIDILTNTFADGDIMVHLQDIDSSFKAPTYLNHYFEGINYFQLLDYNNDNHMDLVTVDGQQNGKLEVAHGNGVNTFDSSEVLVDNRTGYGAIGSQLTLWNNNTDYDLLFSSENKVYLHLDFKTLNDTVILLFTSNTSSPFGSIGHSGFASKIFTVADIDNDNDNDLVIPQKRNSSDSYYWIENTGGTSYSTHAIAPGFWSYLVVDVDGDADLDFIGQVVNNVNNSTEYVVMKMNLPSKTFSAYDTISTLVNRGAHQFAAGDIDGDNDPDMVMSGIMWSENDGLGNFSSPDTLAFGYSALSSIVLEDIDNDGMLDIITDVTRNIPSRQLIVPLFNQGNNVFTPLAQELEVNITNNHAIAAGDFNGNGFKSIVAGSNEGFGNTPILFDFCIHSKDTLNVDICSGDSYTFADGSISTNITVNQSYTSTLLAYASNGCDSIVTEVLNVQATSSTTDTISACNSYTWSVNSITYTNSGFYVDSLQTNLGCDSVKILDLTISQSTTDTVSLTSCDSYTWARNNMTYASSGVYKDTILSVNGCDSIATLLLTIITNDTTINQSGNTLSVPSGATSYQWLDCNNAFATIPGETNNTYSPVANGDYAVEVSNGSCTDTSMCYNYTITGLSQNDATINSEISIYPNPSNGLFSIDLGEKPQSGWYRIRDIQGKVIQEQQFNTQQLVEINLNQPKAVYFIELETKEGITIKKLIKN